MDSSLYDEFGNYIGPEIQEDEEEESSGDEVEGLDGLAPPQDLAGDSESTQAIIIHEDKKYYPDAEEVYPEAETILQDEDTQPITEPIIAPVKAKNFDLLEKELPETTFSFEYLSAMMYKPQLIRNVCLVGALHHGKTLLVDTLMRQTHRRDWPIDRETKYTDTRVDEQARGLSIKSIPISLVLPDSREKSYLMNLFDTPGHANFSDEVSAALRLSDGAVIVVDALEGLLTSAERLIRHAVQENLQIVLLVNCIDRLILELRLPPTDAYHKLRHTIEQVNAFLYTTCVAFGKKPIVMSPLRGNVAFGSGMFGFCFTLRSFAKLYAVTFARSFEPELFAKCLWGDVYMQADRTFGKTPPGPEASRTFVHFVLDPLYKIFSHCLSEERESLESTLKELGIVLRKEDYRLKTKSLIKRVFDIFFGGTGAFVDLVVENIASPSENATLKVDHIYTGDLTGPVATAMKALDQDGPLMIHTAKNYHRPDCVTFDVLGRVMSGTVCKGQRVKVLGESFSLDDDEDMTIREITHLWIPEGRYRVEVSHVPAGVWVLIGGVDVSVTKTSTLTAVDVPYDVEVFRPLRFNQEAVIKIATEPLNPSELPKMLEGLRRIDKAYPLAHTKVEESGEHIILGTGELYLDCVLHDLRKFYGDLEIKVADPVVQFSETVVETSSTKCFAETPNKKNKIHMICEPLEKEVAFDIENGLVSLNWNPKRIEKHFTTKYDWDVLASRSIWAFGPDSLGPNVLLDDSLPTETDKNLLGSVKDLVVQGFQWATREGPLIEENVRSCKFKILDASIARDPLSRGGGQIIPTARRVAYSSLLLASPRLMEPMLFSEIICPADCVAAIYTVLSRRRGHVARDMPRPGTPLFTVHAYLPAIESFGFETDLRTHTSGQAFCSTMFDRWALVPGDPLDKSIVLRPLEPAPAPHLAREFLLKTRRRKGLSEDVSVLKFFDEGMQNLDFFVDDAMML